MVGLVGLGLFVAMVLFKTLIRFHLRGTRWKDCCLSVPFFFPSILVLVVGYNSTINPYPPAKMAP